MKLTKALRLIVIGLLFLIPIFPLIVANSFFFPFITGKAFYFRILVEIAFACWVVLAFLDAKYRPRLNKLTIAVSIFAGIALIADLLGVSPVRSIWSNFERMEGWLTIIHLWAFFIVATSVFGQGESGRRLWHRFLNMSLAVAIIVGIYGFVQLFGGAAIHQSANRIDASLGNAEYMAVYMLFHVFIAIYMFFVAKRKQIANDMFLRWAYPVLAAAFAFLLLMTQTRGTVLALFGGIPLSFLLYALFAKNRTPRRRWCAAGVVILVAVIGIIFWAARDSKFVQSHDSLQRIASININDVTTQARGFIWPMAIKGFTQRPILGWGQENFNYIFNANYNPHMYGQEQWFDRAHSVFLDWLVAAGGIGLLAYLSLYVFFLMAVWKSGLQTSEKSVLTGLIAAYAVHNIFVFDNLASYALFFAVLGFAASLPTSPEAPWFGKLGMKAASLDIVEYIVAPVSVIALIAAIYFLNIRPIEANTGLIAALSSCNGAGADVANFQKVLAVGAYVADQETREQLLSCAGSIISSSQVPGPTKQSFFSFSKDQIQAQTTAAPKDARMYVLGGSFFNSIGDTADAVPLLEKADSLSPNKQSVETQLGSAYLDAGQTDKALAVFKKAYESDTTDMDAAQSYALALVYAGKETVARQIFAADPALFETDHMASAYVNLKQWAKAISIYEKLVAADPTNVQYQATLGSIQYQSGAVPAAIATFRGIEKAHPELKDQVEAAIKQMQAGK